MAHGKRTRRNQRTPHLPAPATNACGKVGHRSRKDARRVASQYPGDRLRAYHCADCGCWHLGHVAEAVRRGDATADDIYRRAS